MNDDKPAATLTVTVDTLFVGSLGTLANDGAASGIDKRGVSDARWLDPDGVAGDVQADQVHHGGAERALNHYPAEHYDVWQARYPGYEDAFVPGALGENISTRGITESDVCVGDLFTLGDATLELAQPRQPCWKIAARTGIAGLARAVAYEARAGWFYRVLEPGYVRAGDRLTRVEAAGHGITLAMHWAIQIARRPSTEQHQMMWQLAELPTLSPEWRKRMANRARRLAEKTSGPRSHQSG